MNSKKDFMAGISTQVGFIIWCKNRASARLCLSSQASFMAHFDHIGFARSNHGTSSTEAMGGGHSFGFDVTSLRGLAPSHPHTDVQENLQCYSLWSLTVYLKLGAPSRCPLQLVFERGRLLSDRLKDFVQLEVLRVGFAVHRLVPSPLLCRHDRAEVAAKNVELVTGNLMNIIKSLKLLVVLAFENCVADL